MVINFYRLTGVHLLTYVLLKIFFLVSLGLAEFFQTFENSLFFGLSIWKPAFRKRAVTKFSGRFR